MSNNILRSTGRICSAQLNKYLRWGCVLSCNGTDDAGLYDIAFVLRLHKTRLNVDFTRLYQPEFTDRVKREGVIVERPKNGESNYWCFSKENNQIITILSLPLYSSFSQQI